VGVTSRLAAARTSQPSEAESLAAVGMEGLPVLVLVAPGADAGAGAGAGAGARTGRDFVGAVFGLGLVRLARVVAERRVVENSAWPVD